MPSYSKITATGSYLPLQILSNHDLEKMIDTTDDWIISRSGIKERHIIGQQETIVDMAYNASIDMINKSNINKSNIDLILVATSTADMVFPSTACLLQQRLGLNNIPAFDLQAACSGFIYALTTADAFIKSKMMKNILIVGVDAISRIIDYKDRNTCVLFGDGAASVLLTVSDVPGILLSKIYADGSGRDSLQMNSHINNGKIVGVPYLQMEGKEVFKMAVKNLANIANEILTETGFSHDQIDWLIPHQANIRIIQATAKHLNISMEKVITTVAKHANTSAASVPLALDYGISCGKIKHGQNLLLEGVGAGFTWGASLIQY
jgi:3-oxoacyl-[acyl-carrier-protein] synthase-3